MTSVFLVLALQIHHHHNHLFFFFSWSSCHYLALQTSVIFHQQHPICCLACFSGSCSYLSSSAPNSCPCLSHLAPHCSSSCSVQIMKSFCKQEPQPSSILSKPWTLSVLLLERDKEELRVCWTLKMMKMLLLFQNVTPICSGSRAPLRLYNWLLKNTCLNR